MSFSLFIENIALADQLDRMQAMQNFGRDISCVRTLITYLRAGDVNSAKAVYNNESDKIRSYPEIDKLIRDSFGIKRYFD